MKIQTIANLSILTMHRTQCQLREAYIVYASDKLSYHLTFEKNDEILKCHFSISIANREQYTIHYTATLLSLSYSN